MQLLPGWEFVSDTVMGGVSTGRIEQRVSGTRLTGTVSLDNNGGFVQMAFDLAPDGGVLDASGFAGIELTLRGNDEIYDLRLRTDALSRPWQSFRTEVKATPEWQTLRLPFAAFEPHRTDAAFDPARLHRIGVLAIGRVFEANVTIDTIGFYTDP